MVRASHRSSYDESRRTTVRRVVSPGRTPVAATMAVTMTMPTAMTATRPQRLGGLAVTTGRSGTRSRAVAGGGLPVEAPTGHVDQGVDEEGKERRQERDRVYLVPSVLLHGAVDDVAESRA